MNKQSEGWPILIQAAKNLESEKYAGVWGNIAGGIIKGFKGYGANIVKDYKGVKSGFSIMQKAELAGKAKGLSKAKQLASYKLNAQGQKQLMGGLKGLGMRVGLPGLITYQALD